MRMSFLPLFLIWGLLLLNNTTSAQDKSTISGYVLDGSSGETLIGANVYLADDPSIGTTSNTYGFYSITLPNGIYNIRCSYLGYSDTTVSLNLQENTTINMMLVAGVQIQEVVVVAEEDDERLNSSEMGTVDLPMEDIKQLPVLFGESDILKTLQLLPGVQSAGEGSSGFYVRGGGVDQNLVLLDEAVVYNSGHLFGFFSVFNTDAIKNTTLIKGGMPAHYGGRLSSVLDITMRDGNARKYGVEGGIGLIASRLTAEGPIASDKASFLVSARRTYAFDIGGFALNGTDFEGTNYYFYDLNAKVNYKPTNKDRFFLSAYFGRDVLNFNADVRDLTFKMPYGNGTATFRWNHLFNERLFVNTSLIYNDYDFSFDAGQDDFTFKLFSGVRDWNAKVDFEYFHNNNHHIRFGGNYTYHKMSPNVINASNGDVDFTNDLDPKYSHDAAIYIEDEITFNQKLTVNVGLRSNLFVHVGPYVSLLDGREYDKGEPVAEYVSLEPRINGVYKANPTTSIKGGFTVTNQFVHLVSNSTSTLPTDIWVPSTEYVKPQRGLQYALGVFKNWNNNTIESSVEVYYRSLNNQIDYREDYVDDVSNDVEQDFVFGSGQAYGVELFVQKRRGNLTGWVGYTLSRTERWFDDIEDGRTFPTTYDRTHDLSVVATWKLSDKWTFGGTFVYGTGQAFTPIEGLYFIQQEPQIIYGNRNSSRLAPYHRMDLSATLTPKQNPRADFVSSWTFSVYNLYNRKNTFFIYTDFDINDGVTSIDSYKVSLFPIIPSVTWNFKWKQK